MRLVCPDCGEPGSPDAKFCRKCGVQLIPERAATPEAVAKRQSFDARIKSEPANKSLFAEYGEYLISIGLTDEGLAQLHRALELDQECVPLLLQIAQVYADTVRWDKAIAQIQRAVQVRPKDATLHEKLADMLLAAGQKEKAFEALSACARITGENLELLRRMRDLSRELRRHDDLIRLCRTIVAKDPDDAATWSFLAHALLATGDRDGAVDAFRAILRLVPDSPDANLHVGIAQHDQALSSEDTSFKDAAVLLRKATSGSAELSKSEQSLASLYCASAILRYDSGADDIEKLLRSVDCGHLDDESKELLADCFTLLGDIAGEGGDAGKATELYQQSLEANDTEAARKRLADIYSQQGEGFLDAGNYADAHGAFEQSLSFAPEDASVASRRDRAAKLQKRRRQRRAGVVLALLLLLGSGRAYWYYGQGSLEISIDPPAAASLTRAGKTIASTEGGELRTGLLRCGTYRLVVSKNGYERVEQEVSPPYGRRSQTIEVTLNPLFGKLKVNSAPPGAAVTVRNEYQQVQDHTPCTFSGLHAVSSHIEVRLPGFNAYVLESKIRPSETYDLGKIVFRGTIVLDSDPGGADVFIDGEARGKTPLRLTELEAKEHQLRLLKQHEGVYEGKLSVRPMETTDMGVLQLDPRGSVSLTSDPKGATVLVDGERRGVTPLTLENLPLGKMRVTTQLEGYTPFEQEVAVEQGLAALDPVVFRGTIVLDSDPGGADVFIDGEARGKTPLRLEDVPARGCVVVLRNGDLGYCWFPQLVPGSVLDLGKPQLLPLFCWFPPLVTGSVLDLGKPQRRPLVTPNQYRTELRVIAQGEHRTVIVPLKAHIRYRFLARDLVGHTDTRLLTTPEDPTKENTLWVDTFSNASFTYMPRTSSVLFARITGKAREGSDTAVMLRTWDAHLEAREKTSPIKVGEQCVFDVAPHRSTTFCFEVEGGRTYRVIVQDQEGDTDTLLSRLPSVDGGLDRCEDFRDSYSNTGIVFATTEPGLRFLALSNRSRSKAARGSVCIKVERSFSLPPDRVIRLPQYTERIPLKTNRVYGSPPLAKGELHEYVVPLKAGTKCRVWVRDVFGYSDSLVVSPGGKKTTGGRSGGTFFDLHAGEDGEWVLRVKGNDIGGTRYSVRVVDYGDVAPQAWHEKLIVDSGSTNGQVGPRQMRFYWFSALKGKRYRVRVRDSYGDTDSFLSRHPMADWSVKEDYDSFSIKDMVFSPTEDAAYFVGVADRGTNTGSDFSVIVETY